MNNASILKVISATMVFLAIVVVILGVFTRLVDAGLGCPDWPTCYGHLWVPSSDTEITTANANFEATPVDTDKTWPEQIHRIFASSLGFFTLIAFFISYQRAKSFRHKALPLCFCLLFSFTVMRVVIGDAVDVALLPVAIGYFLLIAWLIKAKRISDELALVSFIAGFVIVQGLFGMWTVTLKLWPQVVTTHLIGGFFIVTCLLVYLFKINNVEVAKETNNRALRYVSILIVLMVLAQVALGGWLSSNYAALSCPDFPKCQNEWFPAMDMVQGFDITQAVGPNYLGGQLDNEARIAIHITHRVGALAVVMGVFLLVALLFRQKYYWQSSILLVLVLTQVLLGALNVKLALPLSVAVAHNVIALCLFAFTSMLCIGLHGFFVKPGFISEA